MVKAKQLKIMRKKLEKLDKVNNPLSILVETTPPGGDENAPHDDTRRIFVSDRPEPLVVDYCASKDMSNEIRKECLELFQVNMGELYRQAEWNEEYETKEKELSHRRARYLLVFTSDDDERKSSEDMVAFMHFRFDYDDDERPDCVVLYVYEIQIKEGFRGLGIGQRLMSMAEAMAKAHEVEKTMLTVMKRNEKAMSFYVDKLGYHVDEASPSKFGDSTAAYEILSKRANDVKA